jgi:CRP/FNR family transcriptional regulator
VSEVAARELRALPHFRTLPEASLAAVARLARARSLRAGETLFVEGESPRAFFFVRAGAVKLFRLGSEGREQVLHHLGPGRSFAEAAVLSMPAYPAHAVALETPTELLEFAGAPFRELLAADPQLSIAMVSSLSMWLAGLADRVEELSLSSASARLAHHLLRRPARRAGSGQAIELDLARKDLAAHLAMTPETLSRVLRRWQDEGLVRVEGRVLVVLDEDRMDALAEGRGGVSDGS